MVKRKKANSRSHSVCSILNIPECKRSNSQSDLVVKNKIFPKSNRSQGHVEIVLSFVIFLGFLVLIFVFINPFSKSEAKDYSIDYIERGILEKINSNLRKVSVILSEGGDCYNVPRETGINITEIQDATNSRRYIIYFSKELNEKSPHKSVVCPVENFTVGIYSNEKIIIYQKIKNLRESYNGDYVSLKKEIGANRDFLFSFKYMNNTLIPELSVSRKNPRGIERDSKEIPISVIDENGNFYEMMLNIRSW